MAEDKRDWLSRTLTDLRTAAGLSQVAAATAAGFGEGPQHPGSAGQVRLVRIERGQLRPTEDDVRRLCRVYRTSAALEAVCLLWVASDTRTSAVPARVILRDASKYQGQIGAIEDAAHVCRYWQPLLIPGLLQTRDYMRAVFSDRMSGAAVEAAVTARLARTSILDSGKPLTFIVSEGALRWNAGPAVMREQLAHLAAVANHHRVGVIPQRQTVTTFPVHGFGLFGLPSGPLVTIGLRHATVLVGDEPSVAEYAEWFARLEGLAVFGDEVRDVIATAAREYRAEGER